MFILDAIIVPLTTPIITNTPKDLIILISTALCFLWVKTEENDVKIVIVNAVPTVKCIKYSLSIPYNSKIKNKKGTEINPPPIPNSPAKKPTGIAAAIIKKIMSKYSFKIASITFIKLIDT